MSAKERLQRKSEEPKLREFLQASTPETLRALVVSGELIVRGKPGKVGDSASAKGGA